MFAGLVGCGVAGGIAIRLAAVTPMTVVRRVGAFAARPRTTAGWVAPVIVGVP